jgi:phospholipase C
MSTDTNSLSRIKHIVVLMLENRSFDNILGWLYDPDNDPPFQVPPRGQSFEGVTRKELTNPRPDGGEAIVAECIDMVAPHPDPHEDFENVYRQMFDDLLPLEGERVIPQSPGVPAMKGFVANYASAINEYNKAHPHKSVSVDPSIIMQCYRPKSLPVINGLANAYAVCDHWFSSAPTHTFPNRSFVHAGTSSGHVHNTWHTGIDINNEETIFNLLERANLTWRVYHGESLLFSFAYLLNSTLHSFASRDQAKNRFFQMKQFYEDAGNGQLPCYSFIEPRYFDSVLYGAQNDMHPGYLPGLINAPSNLLNGEQLIYDIYAALRNGPGWHETLLIITADEHGGCYDHVAPPATISPDDIVIPVDRPGGSGFRFDRLGVRVPAVIVSPFVEPGTICQTTFDHTSIIKTVIKRFGLKDELGKRVSAANDVGGLLTRQEPHDDLPSIKPRPVPAQSTLLNYPLSGFHELILQVAKHHLDTVGHAGGISLIETAHHMVEMLGEKAKRLFP